MGVTRPNDVQIARSLFRQIEAAHKALDAAGVPSYVPMGGGQLLDLDQRVALLVKKYAKESETA
jgi:hypothetical protein